MQLLELAEQGLDVVQGIGPLRMARHLGNLPGLELAVDLLGEGGALLAQALDFLGDVECRVVLHFRQLLDLRLQLGDGLLEIEKGDFHDGSVSGKGGYFTGSRPQPFQ
jgi:hypothetical protein